MQSTLGVHVKQKGETDMYRVSVQFVSPQQQTNTPSVTTFIAELYQNDELLQRLTSEQTQTLTFSGLAGATDYTRKTCVTNAVGRSNILEHAVRT